MRALRLAAAALALMIAASPATAGETVAGSLVIEQPWTRATPPGAKVAAGYVSIANKGDVDDRLVGGSLEGSERGEIHEMSMEGDVMKMAPLADGLPIPAGATVDLKPGGLHLMFMGLSGRQVEGTTLRGTLVFEKAGTVAVEFSVEAIGATESGGHGSGH